MSVASGLFTGVRGRGILQRSLCRTAPLAQYNRPVLGERVLQARRAKGWSIPQLSKRSGVPGRLIREMEGGSPT